MKHRCEAGGVVDREVLGEASGGLGLPVKGGVGSADAPVGVGDAERAGDAAEVLAGGLEGKLLGRRR